MIAGDEQNVLVRVCVTCLKIILSVAQCSLVSRLFFDLSGSAVEPAQPAVGAAL